MDRLYLIYDIIIPIIIFICIWNGSRKGFLRAVLGLAVYIAAVIGAGIFSGKLPEPVYDAAFRPKIVSAVENGLESSADRLHERLEDTVRDITGRDDISEESYPDISEHLTNPDFSDKLNSTAEDIFSVAADALADTLPKFIARSLESGDTDGSTDIIADVLSGDYHSAAETIEENVIRPTALRILGYVVWSVSFTAILAAGKIIVMIILKVRKIEGIRSADKLLGGALGFVKSAVIITAVVMVVKLIIGISSEGGFFSAETVERTLIFRHIYDLINI